MVGVLVFILWITLVSASDRRLINQIVNLKEDLGYANRDIVSIFEHLEKMNKTIWSNKSGGSMEVTDKRAKEALTATFQSEITALRKGFISEKKQNRRLLIRIKALEKQNVDNDLKDIKSLIEKSNSDVHKELESEKRKNAQLQLDYGAMKGELLELVKNVSTIMESCMSKKTPNVVTLPASTLIKGGKQTTPIPVSRSCKNKHTSGVYEIYLDGHVKSPTSVYCDADTDGGGWIVILRRQDGSVDFNRTWEEYKNGFGDVGWQFWIGNEFLHELTKSKPMELRVDMEYAGGDRVFAKYAVFKVGSEEDKYVLTVSGYSGTAGDALSYTPLGHNGMKFTTIGDDFI